MRSIYTIVDEINREIVNKCITDYKDAENDDVISAAIGEAEDLIDEYVTKEALESISSTMESMMAFHNRILMAYDEYAQFCASFQEAGPNVRAIKAMGRPYETMRDVLQVQRTSMDVIRYMVIDKIKVLSGKMHS